MTKFITSFEKNQGKIKKHEPFLKTHVTCLEYDMPHKPHVLGADDHLPSA